MNICVYGAASDNINSAYIQAGESLGELMAQRGHRLVFGGGASGLMGAVARGAQRRGGEIIGVAPEFFVGVEHLFEGCTQFIKTQDMSSRKQLLAELSQAHIITPGGVGTFDEFFEMLALRQLGRHTRPMAILNTLGYYDAMVTMLEQAAAQSFMNDWVMSLFAVCDSPDKLLDYLEAQGE